MRTSQHFGRTAVLLTLALVAWLAGATMNGAHADGLAPATLTKIDAATFEVVAAKPKDSATYAKPLPLDLIPYQQRADKYHSIGTAFALGHNRYVTAAHVLLTGVNSLWGPPALRDADGHVYKIDKILKFAFRRDFVVFSLVGQPKNRATLSIDRKPRVNQTVYAVGNALGTGVVVRNGLYTSRTPEQQDGQWKWIRFSAAASPGNSGGPLLDEHGKVIGVVLMKSPNENLNYALPISEVLNAPRKVARFNRRMPEKLEVSDTSHTSDFKGRFPLPKSLSDFFATYREALDQFNTADLKKLTAMQSDKLFPKGAGAERIMNSGAPKGAFPRMLVRDSDGTWNAEGKRIHAARLSANGFIIAGKKIGYSYPILLRRPDTVKAAHFYNAPKQVMDLLLKMGLVHRTVGGETVRVTSLGKPTHNEAWTDRWGRHWRIWAWPIAYANAYIVFSALPEPGGYALLMRFGRANELDLNLLSARSLTNFVDVSYVGTLAQWKGFLAEKKLLPDAFKNIHITFDYGKSFHYRSRRVTFSATPDLQPIKPNSTLWLGCSFYPPEHNGKTVWDVSAVQLAADKNDHHWVGVARHQIPPADLDDKYQSAWKKVSRRHHPFDAKAFGKEGMTVIKAIVPVPKHDQSWMRYSAFVYEPGTHSQTTMKHKLDGLLQHTRVTE